MFTANDQVLDAEGKYNADYGEASGMGRYQNGTFATVLDVFADYCVVQLDSGETVTVKPHKWSIYNYSVDRATMALKKTEIGFVKQIPLKVAKAITIHKSQGKTFDKVILSPQIFAPGQLYVALSRVRGPEGLYLTEPVLPEYLKIDKTVEKFYQSGFTWEIKESQLKKQAEVEKKQAAKKPRKKAAGKKTQAAPKKRTAAKASTKKQAAKKTGTAKKTATKKQAAKKQTTKRPAIKKTAAKKEATVKKTGAAKSPASGKKKTSGKTDRR